MYDWDIGIREDEAMKKRISNGFDEMVANFGWFALVWFVMWAIQPELIANQERSQILWMGFLLLAVGFFKGYRDQVKKDRVTEVDK